MLNAPLAHWHASIARLAIALLLCLLLPWLSVRPVGAAQPADSTTEETTDENVGDENVWGFYARLPSYSAVSPGNYHLRWSWKQPNAELLEEWVHHQTGKVTAQVILVPGSKPGELLLKGFAIGGAKTWIGTRQADGSFIFIGQGMLKYPFRISVDADGIYERRTVKLRGNEVLSIDPPSPQFRFVLSRPEIEASAVTLASAADTEAREAPIPDTNMTETRDDSRVESDAAPGQLANSQPDQVQTTAPPVQEPPLSVAQSTIENAAPPSTAMSKSDSSNADQSFGMQLAATADALMIVGVLANSPAERAGLKEGMIVTHVNSLHMKGIPLESVVSMIQPLQRMTLSVTGRGDLEIVREVTAPVAQTAVSNSESSTSAPSEPAYTSTPSYTTYRSEPEDCPPPLDANGRVDRSIDRADWCAYSGRRNTVDTYQSSSSSYSSEPEDCPPPRDANGRVDRSIDRADWCTYARGGRGRASRGPEPDRPAATTANIFETFQRAYIEARQQSDARDAQTRAMIEDAARRGQAVHEANQQRLRDAEEQERRQRLEQARMQDMNRTSSAPTPQRPSPAALTIEAAEPVRAPRVDIPPQRASAPRVEAPPVAAMPPASMPNCREYEEKYSVASGYVGHKTRADAMATLMAMPGSATFTDVKCDQVTESQYGYQKGTWACMAQKPTGRTLKSCGPAGASRQ